MILIGIYDACDTIRVKTKTNVNQNIMWINKWNSKLILRKFIKENNYV